MHATQTASALRGFPSSACALLTGCCDISIKPSTQPAVGGNHVADFLYLHIKHDTRGRYGFPSVCDGVGHHKPGAAPPLQAAVVPQIQDEPLLPFMSAGEEHRQRGEVLSCWASSQASAGAGERERMTEKKLNIITSYQVRNKEKEERNKETS